jgi:hypothetical protein
MTDCVEAAELQELWLGRASSGFSVFADEEEAKEAWERLRVKAMVLFARDGLRPLAWWRFDSPIPYPGDARERSALWTANLLGADEKVALECWWRTEFAAAYEPGYGAERRRKSSSLTAQTMERGTQAHRPDNPQAHRTERKAPGNGARGSPQPRAIASTHAILARLPGERQCLLSPMISSPPDLELRRPLLNLGRR